jgi:hypothetical protein
VSVPARSVVFEIGLADSLRSCRDAQMEGKTDAALPARRPSVDRVDV